jgi:hypothetical protein
MNAIPEVVKEQIKQYLSSFIERLIAEIMTREEGSGDGHPEESNGIVRPFHEAVIPSLLRKASRFERSFSTRLGSTFEQCACLIAAHHHAEAKRNYRLKGVVSQRALQEVNTLVKAFEHAPARDTRLPFDKMVHRILNKAARTPTPTTDLEVVVDLYVRQRDGKELFFEIKSPLPNKGQCLEVTQRLLRIHLIRAKARPDVQAYFAMPYNPFGGSRDRYLWNYAINHTPYDEVVLIGEEFWQLLGGASTYDELLAIYQEVGQAYAETIISLFEG